MKAALAATLLVAAAPGERAPVEHFSRPGSAAPFSPAVRVGDTLYLSGMIGARPDGTMPEGIEAQSRQALDNMRAVLGMAGRSMSDVFKCTVMLEDMADWPAFNRVYLTYFQPGRLPARSAFGVDGLALGGIVEVECLAHMPAGTPA
ncbi:MAG: RidA family protein [Allosphingosinicella sp.]